jgi:hypothetical protein
MGASELFAGRHVGQFKRSARTVKVDGIGKQQNFRIIERNESKF